MSRVIVPGKLLGETVIVPFDFRSRLTRAETISTQVVTAVVYTGVDATPSSLISGAATASGTIVSQTVTAGVAGVTYTLLCTITTSLSQTLQLTAFFTVMPNAA